MALRDLVMGGGGVCAIPGEGPSSSSNPLANFAGSLLGSTSKTQERLRELPNLPEVGSSTPDFASAPVISLPGSEQELEHLHQTGSKVPQFLRSFHNVDQTAYTSAWNDVTGGGVPAGNQMLHAREQDFVDFERIYAEGGQQEFLNEHPREVLSGFFRSFVNSSREGALFHAVQLPELGLSGADKQRILDRSSIMGRHFFAEKGDDFVNAQVTALLQSLDIEDNTRMREPLGNRFSELEEYWRGTPPGGTGWAMKNQWAQEYSQQYGVPNKQGSWADEFQAQNESNSWAEQFTQAQGHMPGQIRDMSAMDQTRQLVDTLSRNNDPKFQNSKFLHFVSKMSRGELIVEDNQIKENIANGWANEYDVQHPNWEGKWAAEFTAGEQAYQDGNWVKEFEHGQHAAVQDSWAEEFSLSSAKTWVDEFDEQRFKDNSDPWEDSYDKFVEEQLRGNQASSTSKWIYVFSDENPYVGHPNPMKEGQDLFRKGLLSEAVLALEAEVLRNPQNAEGWRLLGITHAENDDDRQAIASMVHARDADPTNLEVLLALGVSHTNELEQVEALKYLRGWLQYHPKYATLVPAEEVGHLNHAEVTKLFHDAARMAPDDADIHTVLGVLYNLSREYDKAIQAFQTALELKPRDYSLWNKLGATQANSAQSSDAIYAYQQALDLKPNYVRAWTNMGIGYANQAHYEESIPYYVRALCMNPKADNAWQYIRISLSCAGRSDLLAACDSRDLDALQEQFPM